MIAAAGDLFLWRWHSIPMCILLFLTVLIFRVLVWTLTMHWWFVSVGSLVRNSNKQPLCLCNTISICHEEYSPQEYDVLFTKWPQWNKLRCTCHMEILKKGPIKKKEKPMRHKFTLLREWTWSPTTSLRPKFKYPKPFLLWKIQAFYQNIMSFQ